MHKIPTIFRLVTAITFALIPLTSQSSNAQTLSAIVTRIIDADTVVLRQGETEIVGQLACIDTPDWVNGQPQPHAQASKNRLTQLIPVGSSVRYDSLRTVGRGRSLIVVFHNNRNINLQMVAEGQAELHGSYRQTCPNSVDALTQAQSKAKNQRLGLWNSQ
ncbi:thermonuclease family protein [Spirulina sp. 06S082]|uniref:thermonuclease family protein n=1 Tax=Spirulina sp. 06S082 TaxID=3110248 RepID=UPI002B2049CC|nr:thermonuclease family protein [Spirulina sp. 06S082]MEA5470002.1 thermonuclease family protein [Spirulina sp. 06S082]